MKKSILLGISALAMAGLTTACLEDVAGLGRGAGALSLEIGLDTEMIKAQNAKQSRAVDNVSVTKDNLSLALSNESLKKTWESLSDFDPSETFNVGTYKLEAYYGDETAEGFESPYYYGTTDIVVRDGLTTEAALTAQAAKAMIAIEYTDAFKDYMTDWSADLRTAAGKTIDFAKDETRAAYVLPGEAEVNVTVTKPSGTKVHLSVGKYTLAAKHSYTLTVDFRDEAGKSELIVDWDDTMTDEDVKVDISDYIFAAPAPTAATEGFTSGQTFSIVEGQATAASVSLIARAGFSKVVLTNSNRQLQAAGFPEEIDLVAATPEQQTLLSGLGLKVLGLWKNPDGMAQIDFSGILANLKSDAEFTLQVTDIVNRILDEPVKLSVLVEPLELELQSAGTYVEGEATQVNVSYNGADLENNVKFSFRNTSGMFDSPLEIESVVEQTSRAAASYLVTFKPITATGGHAPESSDYLLIRAKCGDTETDLTVNAAPFQIACEDNDVYATHAFVKVVAKPGESDPNLSGDLKFLSYDQAGVVSTVNYERQGEYFDLKGLAPDTDVKLRVSIDGVRSKLFTLHTEAAAQIPNGNLDASSVASSGNNWENYAFDGWGTANPLTTSQGSSLAYCRISTTSKTDESHTGKAVLLRTCGWGSGNSAAGSSGTSGKCKYTDAGLLHLGSSRSSRPAGYGDNDNITNKTSTGPVTTDDLDCGIEFTSRPQVISFWYKYSPKNSADKGYAEIWLKDADGNLIGEVQTMLLDAQSKYAQKSFKITHVPGTPKAAKIYVKFLSSYSMDFIKRTNDNFSGPGFGNLSDGKYLGSQLYIDDIELTY